MEDTITETRKDLQQPGRNTVTDLPSYDLMGLKVSVFSREALAKYIHGVIAARETKVCFGYSLGYIALFKKYPGLYERCNGFDLMVTDGRFFYLFAKLFGAPLKYDISVPFLTELMLELADECGYSVMFVGSTPETNTLATERTMARFPHARVYPGMSGGRFSPSEQEKLIAHINAWKPDMLFIGTSTPIKEEFASLWKEKLGVRFIVPFGGMIDGLAGKVKLTPPLLKKLGLASFIRVAQEPRRLLRRNVYMFAEIFLRIVPRAVLFRGILRRKNFNLVKHYLGT